MKISMGLGGAAALALAVQAQAVTINLGSNGTPGQRDNVGGWTATAAGAVNQTPYNFGTTTLGLSSDGSSSGTPVPGASPAAFDGLAVFSTQFFLPANAVGATLSYDSVAADDRFVLELNGNVLATSGIFATNVPTPGDFVFTHGGPRTPVVYLATGYDGSANGLVTGTDTAFFTLGATNTLTILVNATYNGIGDAGTPSGLYSGDFKLTSFGSRSIGVTYDVPVGRVPEPAAWALMVVGFGLVGGAVRRRSVAYTA